MWDKIPDLRVIKRIPEREEDMFYEFEIKGALYKVFILVRRWEDNTVALEIHFMSKAEITDTEYTNALTGRNNMQDVMGGVWWAIKEWAKERSKGGNLRSIIVGSKSEAPGDERRLKIYNHFLMKKAQELGMVITKITDITDGYKETMKGLIDYDAIVTKYSVDLFPIDKLKSI